MASQHLPMEMINLILSRLPAKSLMRFRCVRKSWRDLISSPQFIKQFNDDKLHEHVLIQQDSVYSLHRMIGLHGIMVTRTSIRIPYQILQIHGYCNGLVCFSTSFREFNVHLWNPSVRKFKAVPQPLLNITCSVLAFYFVPRFNDYRLLRLPDYDYLDGKSEIYSLQTNSWKLIENAPLYETIDYTFCDHVNGVIYFMALEHDDIIEETIITFDMADEVFRTIKLHGMLTDYDISCNALYPVIFGASLFLIHTKRGDDIDEEDQDVDTDMVDVWERKVHGDGTESWTKKHTIHDWFQPVGFLKNGEMVCVHGAEDTRITSYDPRISGKLKYLPIARMSRKLNLVTYLVETLMLLDE